MIVSFSIVFQNQQIISFIFLSNSPQKQTLCFIFSKEQTSIKQRFLSKLQVAPVSQDILEMREANKVEMYKNKQYRHHTSREAVTLIPR